MRTFRHHRPFVLLFALSLLAMAGGCARQPPSENGSQIALSGRRLKVLLTFAEPINPNYYYYFLMNVSNNINAPGPIPVGAPISGQTYGNGFATGTNVDAKGFRNGFTDFVLINSFQYPGSLAQRGFGLYHVKQGMDSNDRRNFLAQGVPIFFNNLDPDQSQTDSAQIYFEIDLAQLFPDAADQLQAVTQALATDHLYIQVNVVATDIVPVDPQTPVVKQFDSFGDTRDGRGNFLILDAAQNHTITSENSGDTAEPPDNDVYVSPPGSASPNPILNLKTWSIQVTQQ